MIDTTLFHDGKLLKKLAAKVTGQADIFKNKNGRKPVVMEVCGSHTMALARSGIKTALREDVTLIAGPGCPVCVTDQQSIDTMIQLSQKQDVILCTFGDMMRVPGSKSSLMEAKSSGSDIRVIYSPSDSVEIAEKNPQKEVIFLGIGFETTIPALVMAVREAELRMVTNFSIWMTVKLVAPVLKALLRSGEAEVDGFLLPGHVSVVTGKESYHFLKEEFGKPGVITGFEPAELLSGLHKLLDLCAAGQADILNDYPYVAGERGNSAAQELMTAYLQPYDEEWRGIGVIPESGLILKDKYARFDAKKKFAVKAFKPKRTACRCGEVIRGLISPEACVLFHKGCTPSNPVGPCMVSSEGTCAAHYHYMRED